MLRSTRPPPRLCQLVRTLATQTSSANDPARHTWVKQEIQKIYDAPLLDLVFRAAAVHRQHHDPSKIQLCTLMNIKSISIAQ
jgi:biotin synthase